MRGWGLIRAKGLNQIFSVWNRVKVIKGVCWKFAKNDEDFIECDCICQRRNKDKNIQYLRKYINGAPKRFWKESYSLSTRNGLKENIIKPHFWKYCKWFPRPDVRYPGSDICKLIVLHLTYGAALLKQRIVLLL